MPFSAVVTIDAVDVSGIIIGSIKITAEEGKARLANFSIDAPAGNIDPYSYIGQPVVIDYFNGAATVVFTGIIHVPSYDITTGLLSFVCTDNLQEVVELIDRPSIDALLPGFWDSAVFSEPEDNWTYSQQIMSTYPGSFDLDSLGAVRITDWLPKVTPDLTFTDSTIVHDSLNVDMSERRSIINSIKITFANRYQRLWQRELQGAWALGFTFEAWLLDPTDLPTKEMITKASNGWTEKQITFTDLPPSGLIGSVSWLSSGYAKSLCLGANINVARRWVQNITDIYTITVKSDSSITQHGLLEIEQKHTLTADQDQEFKDFDEYIAPQGVNVELGNWVDLTAITPTNEFDTAANLAKVRILSSHRKNKIRFKAELDTNIDLNKTVRVNHTVAQGTGKVSMFEHEINIREGFALTTCTVSIYLPNIASQTDDTLTLPVSPYVSPTGLTQTLPTLSTFLGNVDLAPPDDPTWNGFIGNFETLIGTPPSAPFYDERFSFEIPEITETSAIEFNSISSFNVAIPQDEFIIIK